jgi:hypothetical protein
MDDATTAPGCAASRRDLPAAAVTVATVHRSSPLVATIVAVLLGLTGCGGSTAPSSDQSGPASSSSEPAAASAAAAAEAAADPATASTPEQAALAVALRAADLPAGWSVQANPLAAGADLADNPSLDGICGARAGTEGHRTAKHPVVGLDATRSPQISSEAISYDSAAAAATAVQELVQAFDGCPADQYTFEPAPSADGLAADSVAVQYRLAGGGTQLVVAQARGQVLSVLIGEDPAATAAAARSIAVRIAALPAAAIGA